MSSEKRSEGKFYGPVMPGKIARLATLLSVCLIALSTAALLTVGIVASHEADKQMTASQLILLRNAFQDEFTRMARDQLTVAHWNDAVENVSIHPDTDFMRQQVGEALLTEFSHDQVILIGPDRMPMMLATQDRITFSPKKSMLSDDIYALADETTDGYRAAGVAGRRGIERSKQVKNVVLDTAHYAFSNINGKPAFLSAMPILPENTRVSLPPGAPVILVSVRLLNDEILSNISTALHFDALNYGPVVDRLDKPDSMTISSIYGEKLGSLEWRSYHPGPAVWRVIVPLILALALVFSAVAVSIAIRIGKVSAKLELSEQANKVLALRDSLTGLSNRLHFNLLIDDMIKDAGDRPFAVLACDLDRFKAVNDTFGHAAGDIVIQDVAERLKNAVGKAGIVTRMGGDEFILLVDGYCDIPRLTVLSQEIISAVVQPIDLPDGEAAEVGISVGLVIADQPDISKASLMRSADEALYAAKSAGRGQFVFAHRLDDAVKPDVATDNASPAVAA